MERSGPDGAREDDGGGEGSPTSPARDPRLEIPEILRTPVRRPAERAKPPVMARWSDTAKAWGLAMEFVASIVGGVVLGWLIDRWAGTGPVLAMVGLAVGFVAAFVRIVKQTSRDSKKGKQGKPGA